jgi:hypothetical protein
MCGRSIVRCVPANGKGKRGTAEVTPFWDLIKSYGILMKGIVNVKTPQSSEIYKIVCYIKG